MQSPPRHLSVSDALRSATLLYFNSADHPNTDGYLPEVTQAIEALQCCQKRLPSEIPLGFSYFFSSLPDGMLASAIEQIMGDQGNADIFTCTALSLVCLRASYRMELRHGRYARAQIIADAAVSLCEVDR